MENERNSMNDLDENLKALLSVQTYKVGGYSFDVPSRVLQYKGEFTKLTKKESYLLVLFAANINTFLDRKYTLTTIWKEDSYYNARSMDVYICKLRKLLSKDTNVTIINIHGKGYKMFVN